jgi:hypothetical protein
MAGVQNFAGNLPFPQYGPTESIRQLISGASFIPNALRDVAVAVDPGGLNWHTGERTPARVFVLLLDDEAPLAVSVPGGSPS